MSTPGQFTDEHFVPTAITKTNPVMVTVVGHGLSDLQRLRATRFQNIPVADATGMEQLNGLLFVIQQCTADTFKLYDVYLNPIDGTNFTTFISNGLAQFTLTGPDLNVENPSPPNIYTERIYPWMP